MTRKNPRVILMIESSRSFGRELLTGIARYARLHGPWWFYREPQGLDRKVPGLRGWGANGIIMRDSKPNQPLFDLNIPTILVLHNETERPPYPSIITDSELIGKMAAEHFLDRGYTNFGFCGFDDLHWSQGRCRSFCKHIEQAGFNVRLYEQPSSRKARQWENEQKVLAQWLQACPKPLALFACNDDRGLHAIEACKAAGLAVPDDVAILGVDNDLLFCNLSDVPLSSISMDVEKAGFESAKLLDELMQGAPMTSQQIWVRPTHVAIRQSTDILALQDQEVVAAIQFIRTQSHRTIQVMDVVRQTHLSRRVLEKRFRQILKRSIYEEIRKNRIQRCEEMLIETDRTIAEIANQLAFPGIEQFSRYFKQGTGMSPSEYRKQLSCK